MKLLTLDTTAWNCSVAFWDGGREVAFHEEKSGRDQAALLPQLVNKTLGNEIPDQLLVNLGPGSFTGIRVGLAFAKGFAFGLNIPVKGMDAFLATYLCLPAPEDVLILIDAHRKDVFGRRFVGGVPQASRSLEMADIEKILASPFPPSLAGNGVHPLLDGLDFNELPMPWRGAQMLGQAFFKDPTALKDPEAFYVREADVTCPTKSRP